MNKILIFDFDGVIVESFEACLTSYQEFDPEISAQGYRDRFDGNFYRSGDNRVFPKYADEYFPKYESRLLDLEPVSGISEALESFSKKYKLFIVSSSLSPVINNYLNKYNLHYFTEVIGPERYKDKIHELKYIVEKYGDDAIFVTDTLGDIKEANTLGIKAIGVEWGFHDADKLAEGHPMAAVKSVQELREVLDTSF